MNIDLKGGGGDEETEETGWHPDGLLALDGHNRILPIHVKRNLSAKRQQQQQESEGGGKRNKQKKRTAVTFTSKMSGMNPVASYPWADEKTKALTSVAVQRNTQPVYYPRVVETQSGRILNYRNSQVVAEIVRDWLNARYGTLASSASVQTVPILDLNTRSGFISRALAELGFRNVRYSTVYPASDVIAQNFPQFRAKEHLDALYSKEVKELFALEKLGPVWIRTDRSRLWTLMTPQQQEEVKRKPQHIRLSPFDMDLLLKAVYLEAIPLDTAGRYFTASFTMTTPMIFTPPTTGIKHRYCSHVIREELLRVYWFMVHRDPQYTTDLMLLRLMHIRTFLTAIYNQMLELEAGFFEEAFLYFNSPGLSTLSHRLTETSIRKIVAVGNHPPTPIATPIGDPQCLLGWDVRSFNNEPPRVVIMNPDWDQTYGEWLISLVNLRKLAEKVTNEAVFIWWEPVNRCFAGMFPGGRSKRRNIINTPMDARFEVDGTRALLQALGFDTSNYNDNIPDPGTVISKILLRAPKSELSSPVADPWLASNQFQWNNPNPSATGNSYGLHHQDSGPLRFYFYFISRFESNVPHQPKPLPDGLRAVASTEHPLVAVFEDAVAWHYTNSPSDQVGIPKNKAPIYYDQTVDSESKMVSVWKRFRDLKHSYHHHHPIDPTAIKRNLYNEKEAGDVKSNGFELDYAGGEAEFRSNRMISIPGPFANQPLTVLMATDVSRLPNPYEEVIKNQLYRIGEQKKQQLAIVCTGMLQVVASLIASEWKTYESRIQSKNGNLIVELHIIRRLMVLMSNIMNLTTYRRKDTKRQSGVELRVTRQMAVFADETDYLRNLSKRREDWRMLLYHWIDHFIVYFHKRDDDSIRNTVIGKAIEISTRISEIADDDFPGLYMTESITKDPNQTTQEIELTEVQLYMYTLHCIETISRLSSIEAVSTLDKLSQGLPEPTKKVKHIGAGYSEGATVTPYLYAFRRWKKTGTDRYTKQRLRGLPDETANWLSSAINELKFEVSDTNTTTGLRSTLSYLNAVMIMSVANIILHKTETFLHSNKHFYATSSSLKQKNTRKENEEEERKHRWLVVDVNPLIPTSTLAMSMHMQDVQVRSVFTQQLTTKTVLSTAPPSDSSILFSEHFLDPPERIANLLDWILGRSAVDEKSQSVLLLSSYPPSVSQPPPPPPPPSSTADTKQRIEGGYAYRYPHHRSYGGYRTQRKKIGVGYEKLFPKDTRREEEARQFSEKEYDLRKPVSYLHLNLPWGALDQTPRNHPSEFEETVRYPALQTTLGAVNAFLVGYLTPVAPRPLLISFALPGRRRDLDIDRPREVNTEGQSATQKPRKSQLTMYMDVLMGDLMNNEEDSAHIGRINAQHYKKIRVAVFPLGPLDIVYLFVRFPLDDVQFQHLIPDTAKVWYVQTERNKNKNNNNTKASKPQIEDQRQIQIHRKLSSALNHMRQSQSHT